MTTQPMKSGPENSKEFVEMNFQVKYTGDEDKPVSAQVDIPMSGQSSAGASPAGQAVKATGNDSGSSAVNIYDDANVIFIGPMFIIHRGMQRSLSLKISLHGFLKHAVDPCKA